MSVELLKTNKNWLVWARKSLNYDKKSIAKKIKVSEDTIEEWENTGEISNNDLNSLASIYKQNPAIFFNANNPPKENLPYDFRTVANKKIKISPEIVFEIRKARIRRDNLLNLENNSSLTIPDFAFKNSNCNDLNSCLNVLRKSLNINNAKLLRFTLEDWIHLIEDLGILVFQFYNINIKDLRGYALYYDKLPIIGLNHRENNAAKKFTLFHELAHLLIKDSGLSNLESYNIDNKTEVLCNAVAGETLVPKSFLENTFKDKNIGLCNDKTINKYAKMFGVSGEVIVRRFLSLEYIDKKDYEAYKRLLDDYINLNINKNETPKNKKNTIAKINKHNSKIRFDKNKASQHITANGDFYNSFLFNANSIGALSDMDLAEELDVPLYLLNFVRDKYRE